VRRVRAALDLPGGGPLLILAEEGLDAANVARYVHDRTRPGHPFVAMDCAAMTAAECELRLLGERPRPIAGDLVTLGASSALVTARRGTVFLDRVDELPAAVQRVLARLLRDGEARIAGRDRSRLTARVIAAGPPVLAGESRDGRFRPDLRRRFGALPVTLPPLRARPEDFDAVVARLSADIAAAQGRRPPAFTRAAITVLAALPWPRNIDELHHTLLRVARDCAADTVRQEDLLSLVPVEGVVRRLGPLVSLREARRRFERQYIADVLERHDWRMSDAARTLGIERANLYRKTRQLGIVRADAGERVRS
jgi:DNA-binding NtrC family response regulator